MAAKKTTDDYLRDAQEIIRRKNIELLDQKKTIRTLQKENDTAEKIREEIFGLASHTYEQPPWLTSVKEKGSERGVPTLFMSDWHYGEVVEAEQVGGANSFNKTIAKARAKRLVENTIDLAFNHMGKSTVPYPGIVVCLGGDFISGDIHEDLARTNDRTSHQSVHDLGDILGGCIETLAGKFGRVFLPSVVGNHGRSTRKPPTKNLVYTNYDWLVYCGLERDFRKDKRIRFYIPAETDAVFSIYGHRYLLTHGDHLGVKGGDGIIGAVGPIIRGAMKVHRSEAQIGRDFDTLLVGHYHTYLSLDQIIVNGSLKGYDDYARLRLRASYQPPQQALWLTHPKWGITISAPVFLENKIIRQEKNWVSWHNGN